jgi:hypothetical protein
MNKNCDYAYKVKNMSLGFPGARDKRPKSPEIGKMSLEMGDVRIYIVVTTKI